MTWAEEVANDFKLCLEDLIYNDEKLIFHLTMMAEMNVAHAERIVKVIEKHILEVMWFFS